MSTELEGGWERSADRKRVILSEYDLRGGRAAKLCIEIEFELERPAAPTFFPLFF
jgi:hypothetical protein